MSIDDLYNNFKIVEQEVKGTTSSNSSSENMAFLSSPSTNNTNEVHTAYGVSTASTQSSTASTQVGTASTQTSTANLRFQSYNVVLPPATLVYNTRRCPPPKTDLSYSGLEKFKQSQFESYGPKSSEIQSKNASEDIPNELKEYPDAPLVKNRVLDNKDYSVESPVMVEKKTVVLTIPKVKVVRPKQQEKPVRKTV
nr:hypothetical protein [Tanacetum cinerariifolium]